MEQKKKIKVYGTLMNHTIDPSIEGTDELGTQHFDAIAQAWQLYDQYFRKTDNTMAPVQRFQDVINRRLTAISYIDGVTTIEGDLVVEGDTTLNNITINPNSDINGIELGDLDDVDENVSDPSNEGKALVFLNNEWVAGDVNTTVEHLNDIGDVNANAPQPTAMLIWDNVNDEWKPSDVTLIDLVNRINQLEASILWEKVQGDDTKIQAKDNRSAVANMFFDSSVQ